MISETVTRAISSQKINEVLNHPELLDDKAIARMKQKPYHTPGGKDLMTTYTQLVNKRKVNKNG